MGEPVLNAGGSQFGISVVTFHALWVAPAPPVPSAPWVFEGGVPLGWPPGIPFHKKAPTVLVDGSPGIQQGHSIGCLIPHVPTMLNAFILLHMAVSKHKVMFPVSSVLLEGKPVGTYILGFGGLICGNPVSLPAGVLVKCKGTVETTATTGDILSGLVDIAVEVAIDYLFSKIKGKVEGRYPQLATKKFFEQLKGFSIDLSKEAELALLAKDALNRFTWSVVKGAFFSPPVRAGVSFAKEQVEKSGWKPFGTNP